MRSNWDSNSVQQRIFDDYTEFVKDTFVPEDNDEFWFGIIRKGNELCKKYKDNEYLQDLVQAHWKAVERKAKKNGKDIRRKKEI